MSENLTTNNELNTFLQNIHPEDFAESGVKLILQIEPDETAKQRMSQLQQQLSMEQARRYSAEAQLKAQEGKVQFADAVYGCSENISVQEMAMLLYQSGVDIGENRLYSWLREHEYVNRQGCGQNLPTQKSLEMGVLEFRKEVRITASGFQYTAKQVMVTPKGQKYFLKLLGGKKKHRNHKSA